MSNGKVWATTANNDRDLVEALGSFAIRVPIPHGDCVFHGIDESGADIRICVERKKIPDIVKCMTDGRYMQQLRQAADAGFARMALIIEGRIRPGRDGMLETTGGGGRWRTALPEVAYSRLDMYLDEVALFCGVQVKRTENVKETAAQIRGLWALYQKPPEDHHSLEQVFTPPPPRASLISMPGLVRRVAKEFPGIGWGRSEEVARRFRTVEEMVRAEVEEWVEVPGIGKRTAERVYTALRGKGVPE